MCIAWLHYALRLLRLAYVSTLPKPTTNQLFHLIHTTMDTDTPLALTTLH